MNTSTLPQVGVPLNHLPTDSSIPPSLQSASSAGTSTTAGASTDQIGTTSLLRSLPPDSARAQDPTMKVQVPPTADTTAPTEPVPRRNLSEAFEELYIATPAENASTSTSSNTTTPGMKLPSGANLISPTGVADLHASPPATAASKTHAQTPTNASVVDAEETKATPFFKLHNDLQRDLSQAVINRVSFYGIIHDINKEATAMAANDDSGLNRVPGEDIAEDHSPLVEAVKGPCANPPSIEAAMMQAALIDEEKWLLSAIEKRGGGESRSIQACPPTFLQAMGEREYENPLSSLSNGSRTQLWKPSRSWWEAKSGKNPWIEPKSHNKRWRYLWPLIHYHKFLAKCIKKLKRNGVDVKMSVSPVAAFLREEVCAISDHLASVSLFDSDEWMSCLRHFSGWTDTSPDSEARLRLLVSKLFLRPLAEHGDVESPLLRSQIDEQFLRAMATARSQMEMGADHDRFKRSNNSSAGRPPHQPRPNSHAAMDVMTHHMQQVTNQVGSRGTGVRRPRYPHPQQWWAHQQAGWHMSQNAHPQHAASVYGDDSSVHSSLSGADAYPDYGMYPPAPGMSGQYGYPQAYHHAPTPVGYDFSMSGDHGMYPMHTPYQPDHAGLGFYGHPPVDPSVAYPMHHDEMGGYYGMPAAPNSPRESPAAMHEPTETGTQTELGSEIAAGAQTPYKSAGKTPRSPYWGHLDATIAMGLSTPQTHAKPESLEMMSPEEGGDAGSLGNAQPLLLRQSQYYGYGHGPVSNFVPPSPATQFMMSPQAGFAFNYGYGYSPSHGQMPSHVKRSPANGGCSPAAGRKRGLPTVDDRASPSTVETITESETLSDAT